MGLRITQRDVRNALLGAAATALALWLTAALVPGLLVRHWWSAVLVAIVVGLLDALVRPRLRPLAARVGAVGWDRRPLGRLG